MNNRNEQIAANISVIKTRIAAAAKRSGRPASSVFLLAVTKNIPVEEIRMAVAAGIRSIGESKVQDAKLKFFQLGPAVSWHMLGHLQTNKIRPAAAIFDTIQSVDSLRLAEALNRQAAQLDRKINVLLEVNISGEPQKFGVEPEQTLNLIKQFRELDHLHLTGLMGMAPYLADPEQVRPCFKGLNQLFQNAKNEVAFPERWNVLSMGMTNDFEVAIEEGATLIRIGTGIFSSASLVRGNA